MKKKFYCPLLLSFALLSTNFAADSNDKSCQKQCSDVGYPRCGAWINSDNNQFASGIYLLNEGYANFTCTVHSLPHATSIRWYFEPEFSNGAGSRQAVVCTGKNSVSKCSKDFGEHQVTSSCYLRISELEQSGSYFCAGHLEKYDDAESSKIRVHVFGISQIALYNESEPLELEFGTIGRIRVRVCANPKPHLVWVHRPSGRTVAAGASSNNETASLLYHDLDAGPPNSGPIRQHHYCYVAALILGRVEANMSHAWTAMAWNSVDLRRFDVPIRVFGEPEPSNGSRMNFDKMIIFVLFVLHFL